ncbi:hypothetical protein PISL3812_01214 [Talaromyces islandicus]|uniref:Uncharacterized protein n=1 Tax=Talaromyces islandicus TaxID=28573 RepID=A0A0U1LLI8_TALIS|nr:hypothetical protein PISL3812_01214 [Talaromyces islandicus]
MADFNSNGNQIPPNDIAPGITDRHGHLNPPMIPTSHGSQQPAHLVFSPPYPADQPTWGLSVGHLNAVGTDSHPFDSFPDFNDTMLNGYTQPPNMGHPAHDQVNSMEAGAALAPSPGVPAPSLAARSEMFVTLLLPWWP